MRLLFDQNLSPRLKNTLRRVYPNSLHVRDVGFEAADDMTIWQYAGDHGLTIVSKDSDFRQLSFTLGLPPRVVWIRRGNCSTSEIEAILSARCDDVLALCKDEETAFLALS